MKNFDKLHSMSREEYTKWLNSEFIDYEEIERKRQAKQENCPYCHIDKDGNYLQECFNNEDLGIKIGLFCGNSEVSLLVEVGEDEKVMLDTKGKYCAYCGRQLIFDNEEE